MALVADSDGVAAIAAQLTAAPLVAFDLEFLSADRLVPVLCLIQVAWPSDAPDAPNVAPNVALVDPLAVDAGPIARALAGHACCIAHAARQDLQLLAARFGVAMPRIADTQVMAAFAGLGDQVGLATLAQELCNVSLAKEQQWTKWDQRPLTDAQLAYARADVRYLPRIYAQLVDRLGARLAWALAESSLVAADAVAAAQVTPETAWHQVGGVKALEPVAAAAAIALATWRQRIAIELDKPLGHLMNDRTLLDLARHRPRNEGGVRAQKGLTREAGMRAAEIVDAIARADPSLAPKRSFAKPTSQRAQRWSEIALAIAHLVADQTGVASRLIATRSDAEELARAIDEHGLDGAQDLPAFATWRRELLGEPFAQWLRGELALIGDLASPHGLQLRPTQPRLV